MSDLVAAPQLADAPPAPPQLCLLLGAGASAKAGVPLTTEFVDLFEKTLTRGTRARRTFAAIRRRLETASARLPGKPIADVEAMLGVLEGARHPDIVTSALSRKGYLLPGVGRQTVDELTIGLKEYIRTCCLVDPEATEYLLPLIQLSNVFRPIHVFSTNYDVAIEQFFDSHGLECVDGFELRFDGRRFDTRLADVLLFKLHGSANWFRSRTGRYLKLPIRSDLREITLLSGERAEPLMLYPAQKADYAGPFLELFRRFQDTLRQCEWLLVIGYSFRDPIFRNLIVDALVSNPKLKIVLMCGERTEEVFDTQLRPAIPGSSRLRRREDARLGDRILRLPYRVEHALTDFVTSIFPALQRATAAHSASLWAELHGEQPQWNTALLEYLHAGVASQSMLGRSSRAGTVLLSPELRLQSTVLRSIARIAIGEDRAGDYFWQRAVDTLQGWLSGGLVTSLNLRPEQRLGFAMNFRRLSEYSFSSLSYADATKQLDETLKWGQVSLRCLSPGARADSIGRKLVLLSRLTTYFRSFGEQGMGLREYCRHRSKWLTSRTRELRVLLTGPKVDLAQLVEEVEEFKSGLAKAEWAYIRDRFLGGPALARLEHSRAKPPQPAFLGPKA